MMRAIDAIIMEFALQKSFNEFIRMSCASSDHINMVCLKYLNGTCPDASGKHQAYSFGSKGCGDSLFASTASDGGQ